MSLRTTLSARALWTAITHPDHVGAWWPEATIDPREGGRIEVKELPFKKTKTRAATGRIEEVRSGEYLRFEWRTKGRDKTTHVDVHIGESKRKSKVRVVETGFDRHAYCGIEVERMRDFWRDRLVNLKSYVETSKHAEALEKAAKRDS